MTLNKIKSIKSNQSFNNSILHNTSSTSKPLNNPISSSSKHANKSPSNHSKNISQYTSTSPKFYREKEIQMQDNHPKKYINVHKSFIESLMKMNERYKSICVNLIELVKSLRN